MHGKVMKVAMGIFGLGLAVMPMLAHHSVEQQYDMDKMVTIQGVVTKIVWVNPHARLWVDIDGAVSSWEMELPPPHVLKIMGVKMDFVREGDHVNVTFWRAKDGSRLGNALTVTAPDGRVIDFPPMLNWHPVSPRGRSQGRSPALVVLSLIITTIIMGALVWFYWYRGRSNPNKIG